MDILIGTSLIAAFLAGIAALFAPCCITVLLPAYLGSIFRQKRTVYLMTLVFFLGILAVFLPLGLGIAAVGEFLKYYHNQLYTIGGAFLILLGISILLGKHFSFPFSPGSHARGKIKSAGSVLVLGIFSGFATLCCAPVLAGVMALSALPGSLFWGGIYSLVYALGMVMPLFFIAYFLDQSDWAGKFTALNRRINYSLAGREISITLSEFTAGVIYVAMGALTLYLNFTNRLAMGGGTYQATINIYLARLTEFLNRFLDSLPWWVSLAVVFAALFLIFGLAVSRLRKLRKADKQEEKIRACCSGGGPSHHHEE